MPDLSLEAAAGCDFVCGIDEVGRGPWAGPVVAAVVILDRARLPSLPEAIDDSKVLSPRRGGSKRSATRRIPSLSYCVGR
jgi:ribonuclease HII